MRTRALSIVAGIAAIAAGSLLVASPASAATLPEGQRITIVEQIEGSPGGSRMWFASPDDALTTENKPAYRAPPPIDIEAIDVDDDGFGYATESRFDGETTRTAWLWKANANIGELTDPVQILSGDQNNSVSECQGLDYSRWRHHARLHQQRLQRRRPERLSRHGDAGWRVPDPLRQPDRGGCADRLHGGGRRSGERTVVGIHRGRGVASRPVRHAVGARQHHPVRGRL